jgi:hypothetical protein
MQSRFFLSILGVLFSISAFGSSMTAESRTAAEQLVARLPPGLLGFVATSGGNAVRPAFDRSHIGELWRDENVQTFYRQLRDPFLKKLKARMPASDPGTIDTAAGVLKLALRHPAVLALGLRPGSAAEDLYGFLVIEGGGPGSPLAAEIDKLQKASPKGDIVETTVGGHAVCKPRQTDGPPLFWGWVDHYFVVTVNDREGSIFSIFGGKPSADFKNGYLRELASVRSYGDAVLLYLDLQRILGVVVSECTGTSDEPDAKTLSQVLEKLGLKNIRSLAGRVGFAGPDLAADLLLAMPDTHAGLLKSFRPIDPSILDLVPAGAVNAAAWNVDLAGMYDLILDTIKTGDAEEFSSAMQAIEEFEKELKVNIRRDVLANLAGPMVDYAPPPAGPTILPIIPNEVFIARLKDPKAFETALAGLEKYAAAQSDGSFIPTTQPVDGRTYHLWVIPPLALVQVTPCWTIRGGDFVFGTSATACEQAIRHAATRNAGAASLRASSDFARVMKDWPKETILFKYVDHRLQLPQTIQTLQQVWPMVAMSLQKDHQLDVPMVFPPGGDLARHMGLEIDYFRRAPDGIRNHAQGPVLSQAPAIFGVAVIGAAALVPASSGIHKTGNRSQSAPTCGKSSPPAGNTPRKTTASSPSTCKY